MFTKFTHNLLIIVCTVITNCYCSFSLSIYTVILKTINPRLVDSDGIWWQLSYYLCYINSTLNPVCYALCNHNFRRTYKRILTCGILGGKERTVHTNAIVNNANRSRSTQCGRTAYINANFETQAQRARRLRQQAQQRFHWTKQIFLSFLIY